VSVAPLVALTMLVLILSACVIPVPLGGKFEEVSEKSVGLIKPGVSTRADVLLLLGNPTVRGETDGYFLYSWHQTHGGAILAFPYPIAVGTAESCHWLAIRFTLNGIVAAATVFHGEIRTEGETIFSERGASASVCATDSALTKRIEEWLAEPLPVSE